MCFVLLSLSVYYCLSCLFCVCFDIGCCCVLVALLDYVVSDFYLCDLRFVVFIVLLVLCWFRFDFVFDCVVLLGWHFGLCWVVCVVCWFVLLVWLLCMVYLLG